MINLIQDSWIPAIRTDGTRCLIAPWQIGEKENPVTELVAVRPDFQGALYQFLLGLLQTVAAPEDGEEWAEYYETAMTAEQLKVMFSELEPAFELFSDVGSPAFLQDLQLNEGEAKPIAGLLIEAPGGKTIKDNLDFFIKSGRVNHICPSCAAQALFTLQTNAPSGGVGHRVGLRGGGPLTTLLRPVGASSLWQKLWLNVMDQSVELNLATERLSASIFPWLGETRVSDKTGAATFPEDVDPLQMYWGMPRRIRLELSEQACQCDLCGEHVEQSVSQFVTRNYGVNYDGAWMHPLTPYRIDPKNKQLPLSLKGQKGGLSYRHWLGLTLTDEENGDKAAKVISDFYRYKETHLTNPIQLWCFGYDMDNMKARCWYEQMMPVLQLSAEQALLVQNQAQYFVNAARDSAQLLRNHVKQAWYRRPKDVGGDITFVDAEFYQATSVQFYALLNQYVVYIRSHTEPSDEFNHRWYQCLNQTLNKLFGLFTLDTTLEELDLKRVMQAQVSLFKNFNKSKSIKAIKPVKSKAKEA